MPIILPTAILSLPWMANSSSSVCDSHGITMLPTSTLKSAGEASPPCFLPPVAQNCGPWNPFWQVTTSLWNQNPAINPHIFDHTLYPASVCSSRPWSRLSYTLLRSMNTRNRGYWSTLDNYCASFSSIIAVRVPLPVRNPCNKLWNCTTVLIWVSITASTIFHTISIRLIPQVSAFPFGISTNTV